MWWWIKARRAHTVALTGWVVTLGLGLAIGDSTVELPSLVSVTYPAVLTMFIPIPLVSALMLSLESRIPAAEASGVRRLKQRDAALVSTAVVALLAAAVATSSEPVAAVGRNAAFLIGLMLAARPFGQLAVMLPVAWTMLVVFISRPAPDPSPWSVLPEAAGVPHASAAAAVMFSAGIAVLFLPKEHR
ncbi:hypothetical protein [Streptomyces sp. 7N604]|uniref:hypothetical protein n=1 Tax=Streptomyces sp. 7N604 TaxID=3457415 RepID=UPI003FD11140